MITPPNPSHRFARGDRVRTPLVGAVMEVFREVSMPFGDIEVWTTWESGGVPCVGRFAPGELAMVEGMKTVADPLAESVARGAALLDEKVPDWAAKVDIASVGCEGMVNVWAQVREGMPGTIEKILGICRDDMPACGFAGPEDQHEAIGNLWRATIAARTASPPENKPAVRKLQLTCDPQYIARVARKNAAASGRLAGFTSADYVTAHKEVTGEDIKDVFEIHMHMESCDAEVIDFDLPVWMLPASPPDVPAGGAPEPVGGVEAAKGRLGERGIDWMAYTHDNAEWIARSDMSSRRGVGVVVRAPSEDTAILALDAKLFPPSVSEPCAHPATVASDGGRRCLECGEMTGPEFKVGDEVEFAIQDGEKTIRGHIKRFSSAYPGTAIVIDAESREWRKPLTWLRFVEPEPADPSARHAAHLREMESNPTLAAEKAPEVDESTPGPFPVPHLHEIGVLRAGKLANAVGPIPLGWTAEVERRVVDVARRTFDEMMVDWRAKEASVEVTSHGRLVFDPNVSADSPVVKETWVTVAQVVSLVVDGCTWADILRAHPELVEADIAACLAYSIENDGPDPTSDEP